MNLSLKNALYGAKILMRKKPGEEKSKKPSLIRELMQCPDGFRLDAGIEDHEIVIRIRKNK